MACYATDISTACYSTLSISTMNGAGTAPVVPAVVAEKDMPVVPTAAWSPNGDFDMLARRSTQIQTRIPGGLPHTVPNDTGETFCEGEASPSGRAEVMSIVLEGYFACFSEALVCNHILP